MSFTVNPLPHSSNQGIFPGELLQTGQTTQSITCLPNNLIGRCITFLIPDVHLLYRVSSQFKNATFLAYTLLLKEAYKQIDRSDALKLSLEHQAAEQMYVQRLLYDVKSFNIFFNCLLLDPIFQGIPDGLCLRRESLAVERGRKNRVEFAEKARAWMRNNPQLLQRVTDLSLSNTGLKSVPYEIYLLPRLQTIDLTGNPSLKDSSLSLIQIPGLRWRLDKVPNTWHLRRSS